MFRGLEVERGLRSFHCAQCSGSGLSSMDRSE